MNKFTNLLICSVFPLVLSSCQGYDGWFSDDYNSDTEYHHGHSGSQAAKTNETVVVGEGKAHAAKTSSASSAAAPTASSPAAAGKKGSGVPVEAPAVPSVAPTVGQ